MGLARDPDRFRCGINAVGVTDISLMFSVAWSDFAYSDWIRYTAKEMIGDPDRDGERFRATSPLENAQKIKAPVLMAYGGEDHRVPIVHGERMRDALARNGTPVEWVQYPDEGHGFLLEKNRFDYYQRVERALVPGGVLFVGNTERIFNPRDLGFTLLSPFFYQKALA